MESQLPPLELQAGLVLSALWLFYFVLFFGLHGSQECLGCMFSSRLMAICLALSVYVLVHFIPGARRGFCPAFSAPLPNVPTTQLSFGLKFRPWLCQYHRQLFRISSGLLISAKTGLISTMVSFLTHELLRDVFFILLICWLFRLKLISYFLFLLHWDQRK